MLIVNSRLECPLLCCAEQEKLGIDWPLPYIRNEVGLQWDRYSKEPEKAGKKKNKKEEPQSADGEVDMTKHTPPPPVDPVKPLSQAQIQAMNDRLKEFYENPEVQSVIPPEASTFYISESIGDGRSVSTAEGQEPVANWEAMGICTADCQVPYTVVYPDKGSLKKASADQRARVPKVRFLPITHRHTRTGSLGFAQLGLTLPLIVDFVVLC